MLESAELLGLLDLQLLEIGSEVLETRVEVLENMATCIRGRAVRS